VVLDLPRHRLSVTRINLENSTLRELHGLTQRRIGRPFAKVGGQQGRQIPVR
jgi:hypothetical protein